MDLQCRSRYGTRRSCVPSATRTPEERDRRAAQPWLTHRVSWIAPEIGRALPRVLARGLQRGGRVAITVASARLGIARIGTRVGVQARLPRPQAPRHPTGSPWAECSCSPRRSTGPAAHAKCRPRRPHVARRLRRAKATTLAKASHTNGLVTGMPEAEHPPSLKFAERMLSTPGSGAPASSEGAGSFDMQLPAIGEGTYAIGTAAALGHAGPIVAFGVQAALQVGVGAGWDGHTGAVAHLGTLVGQLQM